MSCRRQAPCLKAAEGWHGAGGCCSLAPQFCSCPGQPLLCSGPCAASSCPGGFAQMGSCGWKHWVILGLFWKTGLFLCKNKGNESSRAGEGEMVP